MHEDIFRGMGVEVTLSKPDDFLKIAETLTRIGVASTKDNCLYQSCHILHKQGRYAIVHFKELFAFDGKETDIAENDISRRNTIANLLAEWKLVRLVDPDASASPIANISQIKILPFGEKSKWNLISKYTIGSKRKR